MADPTAPDSALERLFWELQGEYQVATDGNCLYMRDKGASSISGIVFAVLLVLAATGYGARLMLTDTTASGRAFAALVLLVAAVFTYVIVLTARRKRWMIVYDRGTGGTPGAILHDGKRLPLERVRSLSTRQIGGSPAMPRVMVVAELHDGTFEGLGPAGVSTWPAHYGQQAATWMGVPFRHSGD